MIEATLDALNVTRIGHGVRAIEDPATVERLVRENITLEVNPGSNISLSIFPSWADHSWDEDALRSQNMDAMDAAFCDQDTKTRIKARL